MRIGSRLLVGLGVVLVAAGCDSSTAPGSVTVAEAPAGLLAAEAELHRVSRALASALSGRDVRMSVRDAMRDSPWDVHQISLREYLDSPAGGALLAAAAQAAGETPAAFAARVRALPDLDFYVPSREQRKSWTGAGSVVLAAGIDPESRQLFGYDADGRSVDDPRGAGGAGNTVMLLHPAEPRGYRNQRQPLGVGDVIQTLRDGERAERLRWISAEGKVTEMPIGGTTLVHNQEGARFNSATVHGDSTYLDYIHINFTDPGDDAEITVYANLYAPDGSYMGEYQYSNYSMPWNTDVYPHAPLSLRILPDSSNAYFRVTVREDDSGFFNGDDWFGPRDFTWVDRAQTRSLQVSNDIVSIELDWTRRPSQVYTTLAVSDAYMVEGSSDYATATRVDQYGYAIPGSFTVGSWYTGHTYVASIASTSGSQALVDGHAAGQTSISATYGGKTGSGTVTVEAPCVPTPPAIICDA